MLEPEPDTLGVIVADTEGEDELDGRLVGENIAEVEGAGVSESKFEPVVEVVTDGEPLCVLEPELDTLGVIVIA